MSGSRPGTRPLPPGYAFVRELGDGGNGWVALAHQTSVKRTVAIKTINANLADAAAVSRLRREGRVIASLRHPCVITVYELVVTQSGVSLVMEHVPGGDLRQAIDAGSLTGSHAIRILGDVATALEYAHQRGVVHRDVKPGNVLLCSNGRAKLADFGLARLPRSTDGFRTITGAAAGTPMYMAPEQILQPDVESPTIDAYAFAVLAYELLTGGRPFAATELAGLVNAHLHTAPTSPWQFAPGLPLPAGEILLAGLAKRPADRPTPGQLAAALNLQSPLQWDTFFRTPGARAASSTRSPDPLGGARARPDFNLAGPFEGNTSHMAPAPPPRRIGRAQRRAITRLAAVLLGIAVGILVVIAVHH